MSRRKARLTESIQQLNDTTIAQAHGLANIQTVIPGSQAFDPDTDLVLMDLSVPATVLLPSVASAVDSYVYTARNLGTADLTFTTFETDLIDQSLSSLVVPPGGARSFTAILRDGGVQEWITILPGGPVSSVFGRTGDVTAADGDYTFALLGGDIEGSDTANTDTNRVLAPDGAGGVQWRDDPAGTTTVNTAADFGTAVGGVITLLVNHVYNINASIDLGTDVLEGHNITLIGNQTLQTLISTVSTSPLISSDGDGNVTLLGLICSNSGGPFVNLDLGALPLSVAFMDSVFFVGDPLENGTGIGTLGTISNTDRISIQSCFFQSTLDGFKLDGTLGEVSFLNCSMTSRLSASAYIGIEVLSTATSDIFVLGNMRFTTKSAADRVIKFSTSATYTSPVRLRGSTIRGPGTFIDAAGLQKTDPDLIATDNEGTTAPTDSLFTGTATYKGNTDETVIASIGAQVRIGNGTVGHTLFNGGSFVERFTLSGAQTQLQEFTYNGKRTRTFEIELNCQLDRVGGGTVIVELAIQVNNVTITDSESETEVGNASSPGLTKTTVDLDPADDVQLVIANQSSTANLIVNSATWTIRHLN